MPQGGYGLCLSEASAIVMPLPSQGARNAPTLAPWLKSTMDSLSDSVFGAPWRSIGVGGSIPFMAMLAETYPSAQFVVTGAAGPDSNAHVPDEWLNIGHAVRITEAVALILDAHARR